MSIKLSVLDQSIVPAGFSPADALQNTIELARVAEGLGYSRYWIAEHHATQALASPAPEILITRVAAETKRMHVGSGGVLLPHYSPLKVVEVFRMLHALYPDRIDLGIGRAPGGSGLDAYALQFNRTGQATEDDFGQKLLELLAFFRGSFPEKHPFHSIKVSPDMPGMPGIWLLGSSGWSADAAASLGLSYAAAHFINPSATRSSIEHYYANFKPSAELKEPRALIAAGAICADTEAEAHRMHASQRLRRLLRQTGDRGPIPTPEDALARLSETTSWSIEEEGEWPRVIVGNVEQVHEGLSEMSEQLHVDELMLITVVHGHEARLRSYELLAGAFDLTTEN